VERADGRVHPPLACRIGPSFDAGPFGSSRPLLGRWLTAIFGGITLDLRDARPAPEGASINATVAFGGIDILCRRAGGSARHHHDRGRVARAAMSTSAACL
jgi:hypothetical protein